MSIIELDIKKEDNYDKNMDDDEESKYKTMKQLLNDKKIDLNNNDHIKYMLSLTLKEEKINFDFQYLLTFLLNYRNEQNSHIFYEFFFHCCEIGKLNYVTLLLNNGFSINYQNILGETPMHIAIAKKDINLIKLLMEYNPDLSITTYKDLSCYNYADISQDDKIKHLINSKITDSKEIKSKLKTFINNVDTKNNIESIESVKKHDILNYCGETYKSSTKTDASEIKISDEEPIKIKDIINNKNNNNNNGNEYISDNKELFENNRYIKKKNYSCKGMNPIISRDKLLDKKDNNDTTIQLYKTIYQKKKISSSKPEMLQNKYMTEKKTKQSISIIKRKNLKNMNGASYSFDELEQAKNENGGENKNINKDDNNYIKNNRLNLDDNENNNENQNQNPNELELFFIEINLPKEYAEKFIENGFDDLNLLLFQTKSGIALTDQNLKDIGIHPGGERAKILIHLEEKAGVIPYILEKNKIYADEHNTNKKNNSLFKFLASIKLEQYEKNFIDNGYNNSELLFSQMITRQPINEEMLKNEFNIEKKGHRLFLYNNLVQGSKEYVGNLKNKNKTNMVFDGKALKECEPCVIY